MSWNDIITKYHPCLLLSDRHWLILANLLSGSRCGARDALTILSSRSDSFWAIFDTRYALEHRLWGYNMSTPIFRYDTTFTDRMESWTCWEPVQYIIIITCLGFLASCLLGSLGRSLYCIILTQSSLLTISLVCIINHWEYNISSNLLIIRYLW